MKKIPTLGLLSILMHLTGLFVVGKILLDVSKWYFNQNPAVGAESATGAAYLYYISRWHEFLGPLGWKYIWFGGNPVLSDFPTIYFLLLSPFAKIFGPVQVFPYFAMFTFFIFAIFSYLLFFGLSKNKSLAVFLTVLLLTTSNLYISLVRVGDIPFWATQALLPVSVYLLVKFVKGANRRFLYAGTLISGLGLLGHPYGFIYFAVPLSVVILFFYNPMGVRAGRRFLETVWFLFFASLVGLPTLIFYLKHSWGGFFSRLPVLGNKFLGFGDQYILLLFLIIFFVLWILSLGTNKKKHVKIVSPFILFLIFAIGLVSILLPVLKFEKGEIALFFFLAPFAACVLMAVLFEQIYAFFEQTEVFHRTVLSKVSKKALLTYVNICFLLFALAYLYLARGGGFIEKLQLISLSAPYISENGRPLKLTSQFDLNDKNRRAYTLDSALNVLLPMSFEMPLAGGQLEPALSQNQKWGMFWLETVFYPPVGLMKSSLISDWRVPEEIVDMNARFLMDWNAIYYLVGKSDVSGKINFASNILNGGFIERVEEQAGNVSYFKIKEDLTSPILGSTNASAILHIGDLSAYDTIYRFLGMRDLNSRRVVVANNSKFIDDFSESDLAKFDAVILYQYDYHSRSDAWDLIKKYLTQGGKVYIDTGPEGYEAATSELPDFFPIKRTVRTDIGVYWDIKKFDEKLTRDINFDAFSPLDFDGEAWNVSHPVDDRDLNPESEIIIKNNDLIVAVSRNVGSGKLIWTGFNLPYHILREYNVQESNFFYNLLSEVVDLSEKNTPSYEYRWVSPENRQVTVAGARGVLFKEEFYGGWTAKGDQGKKLKIFKAGPTSPGFMYVPFDSGQKPDLVVFKYSEQWRFLALATVSVFALLFLSDKLIRGR